MTKELAAQFWTGLIIGETMMTIGAITVAVMAYRGHKFLATVPQWLGTGLILGGAYVVIFM